MSLSVSIVLIDPVVLVFVSLSLCASVCLGWGSGVCESEYSRHYKAVCAAGHVISSTV